MAQKANDVVITRDVWERQK